MRLLAATFLVLVLPAVAPSQEAAWPGKEWMTATAKEAGMDLTRLHSARDYALTTGGSGYITRHGKLVLSWGDVRRRYDLKSTTKSFGATALGIAIKDGKIGLSDKATKHHPSLGAKPESNKKTGWLEQITIQHLATQTAGFRKRGGYERLVFAPGSQWLYTDGGPNWLAECITLAYRRDVNDLMFERVFTPIGIDRTDLTWRRHAYRPKEISGIARREFGSGIHANVDAMARVGYLYLRNGRWKEKQILPKEFVARARTTVPSVVGVPEFPEGYNKGMGNASDHYGLLWWNNADGTLKGVPRSTYWSWGLFDSLIVVIPELDVVVSRACRGKEWKRPKGASHYDVLQPFLAPIVASVQRPGKRRKQQAKQQTASPYPPSPVIKRITWAPKSKIIRQARGGDNWPLTWADDGHLYTAYGDGHGFKPNVKKKLSMGFARVTGTPADFRGINIRSPSGETYGGGSSGKKASGLLMVDGVLYMWARNAGNAQLAWSNDRAKTWTWADWKLTTSFGYPTFLNFGQNYAGARDKFVYIYSHDSDSAYEPSDRMVMARVPRSKMKQRDAYEFFVRRHEDGSAEWTSDISRRGAVFNHRRSCYRSGVSFNKPLGRYLWVQILPGNRFQSHDGDPRFSGGFGVYDAPQPWGPWSTVYFTTQWDVGPGETASFPPKWMSANGMKLHLVFSGDDCFSVRAATITRK